MRISIVVAMARNGVIGTETGLPWHLPRELKQFRLLTTGKPVVMGRTTFGHIGRPLPNRANIILTRQADFTAAGIRVAHSIEEALVAAREEAERLGADEVMVIGGAEVYRAFWPRAERLYVTVVGDDFEGTATFPAETLAGTGWAATARQSFAADAKNPHPYTFHQLDRGPGTAPLGELLGVS